MTHDTGSQQPFHIKPQAIHVKSFMMLSQLLENQVTLYSLIQTDTQTKNFMPGLPCRWDIRIKIPSHS